MSEAHAIAALEKIVSRETMQKFSKIHQELVKWSGQFNLVAPTSLAQYWSRHVLDSAQLFSLVPTSSKTWLDFGSGAGFPGMILAIMLCEREGATMTLVESNGKKTAFLQHCARITGAPVTVLQQRIEQTKQPPVNVVTARAVADLQQLLIWADPLCGPDTVLLFPKGKNLEQELTLARKQWDIDYQLIDSCTERGAKIVKIGKFARV